MPKPLFFQEQNWVAPEEKPDVEQPKDNFMDKYIDKPKQPFGGRLTGDNEPQPAMTELQRKVFRREDRYVVIKVSDISEADRMTLDDYPHRKAVVVEADWPEYEAVWKMIEARFNAKDVTP